MDRTTFPFPWHYRMIESYHPSSDQLCRPRRWGWPGVRQMADALSCPASECVSTCQNLNTRWRDQRGDPHQRITRQKCHRCASVWCPVKLESLYGQTPIWTHAAQRRTSVPWGVGVGGGKEALAAALPWHVDLISCVGECVSLCVFAHVCLLMRIRAVGHLNASGEM